MTESHQLRGNFGDRLFEILSEMIVLRDLDTRNRLLRGLPSGLEGTIRRSSAWQTDLHNIVEIAEWCGELDSGEWTLVVIAKNALSLVKGTQFGRKLESLLAELDRPIPTTYSSIHTEFQRANHMTESGGPTTQSGIYYQNSVTALYLGRLCDASPRPDRDRIIEVRLNRLMILL